MATCFVSGEKHRNVIPSIVKSLQTDYLVLQYFVMEQ